MTPLTVPLSRREHVLDAEGKQAWDAMVSGEMYSCEGVHLIRMRAEARRLTTHYNGMAAAGADRVARAVQLAHLFGDIGRNALVEAPLRCDYGLNVRCGVNFYMNFDCVLLDAAPITFGDDVLIGPGVHFYTSEHPLDAHTRHVQMLEMARPITVGSKVWIGGRAVVLAGVTIGDGAVVGAGSIVTKDVPPYTLVVGNPARVIRQLS